MTSNPEIILIRDVQRDAFNSTCFKIRLNITAMECIKLTCLGQFLLMDILYRGGSSPSQKFMYPIPTQEMIKLCNVIWFIYRQYHIRHLRCSGNKSKQYYIDSQRNAFPLLALCVNRFSPGVWRLLSNKYSSNRERQF